MSKRTLRGKVAIAGVGETPYYKHGKAPVSEFKLALQAILAACEDAGIDPRRIDGFASYSNDRNEPSRLAAALGIPAMRFSNMNWGGGGGGGSAAVGNAAAAVACGMADCVVVFRALAQGQFQRFGAACRDDNVHTFGHQRFGAAFAKPLAGSANQRPLAINPQFHRLPLLVSCRCRSMRFSLNGADGLWVWFDHRLGTRTIDQAASGGASGSSGLPVLRVKRSSRVAACVVAICAPATVTVSSESCSAWISSGRC